MRKLISAFYVLLGALIAPLSAFAADTVKLNGKDTWDFYAYGNGEALAQILTAVKLTVAPDHGGGGFRYLLMFLAIIGFVVLAVRAGFDPGKNFLKMFGFIFLVWAVMYGTTGARANLHVYDRMSGYSNVVAGVPAIVALPASIVSQTGEWLTQQIEQNFGIPNSLKISGSGQYSLFTKVMSDMNKFVITDPDLSNNLKAYVGDCVVPALALGKVSAADFKRDQNLVAVLKKAQSKPIMTRYYGTCALTIPGSPDPRGALTSCERAFECIETDLDLYADALLEATNKQWENTGIMVPFEQAMSEALAQASAGGANPMARYARPQGAILQKALASHLAGDFRDAAVRTGNNEVMTAVAIAQAEQSQKSSWYTAAELFKNMMGYVYLVLQAFIFAVIPVIIIALMIPGLGGKIFTNYFQILVWLTLWTPMLAIVNFLITVFGGAQMRETLSVVGLAMENSAVMTEYSNNLVIAAQFIGTMVPLITWGLVKGAMAFTEFVSHGIGSSFATQAGAQAATGNVSMGNMSMDNTTMNKYSTMMSSAVGMQDVQMHNGAGKLTATAHAGGSALTIAGKDATPTTTHSETVSASDALSGMTQDQINAQKQHVANTSRAVATAKQIGTTFQDALSLVTAEQDGQALTDRLTTQEQTQLAENLSEMSMIAENTSSTLQGRLGAGIGGKTPKIGPLPGLKLSASLDTMFSSLNQRMEELASQVQDTMSKAQGRGKEFATSQSRNTTGSDSQGVTHDASLREAIDNGQSRLESFSAAVSQTETWVKQQQVMLQSSVVVSQSSPYASGYDGRGVDVQGNIEEIRSNLNTQGGDIRRQVGDVSGSVERGLAAADGNIYRAETRVDAGIDALGANAPGKNSIRVASGKLEAGEEELAAAVEGGKARFTEAAWENEKEQKDFNSMGAAGTALKSGGKWVGGIVSDTVNKFTFFDREEGK